MIKLYYTAGSGASRLVLMVIAALRLDVELEEIDMQNISQDFISANPQHTVPTLVDDGYALWESRAVARYLANKYDGNNSLYPHDPQERGTIDSRLDFDLGTLCPSFAQYFQPQVFTNTPPGEQQIKKLKSALAHLNTFLEGRNYAVGSQLTIADLALAASVSTIEAAEVDLEPYPNIIRWFQLIKESAPGYKKYNEKGLIEFKRMVANMKQVRTDLEKQVPSASSPNPTVIRVITQDEAIQASPASTQDAANQAGPSNINPNIYKLIYENLLSVGSNTLSTFEKENVHRSTVTAKPLTNADLLNQFKYYKVEKEPSILNRIIKKKSDKSLEARYCSCSSHDETASVDIPISMVYKPSIVPMLDDSVQECTASKSKTSNSSRHRFFSRKVKNVDKTCAECSQPVGLPKNKKSHFPSSHYLH